MRRALLLAFVAALLGGCADEAATPALPAAPAPSPPAVVFERAGEPVPAADLPDAVPRFETRPVPAAGFEPTLGVTPSGTVLLATAEPQVVEAGGRRTAVAKTEVLRSRDEGRTWERVTPALPGGQAFPTTLDPYLHVDPLGGRVFVGDLYAACQILWWSDDEGDTWRTNPAACDLPPYDHQTVFTGPPAAGTRTQGYPSVVFTCGNHVLLQAVTCARSLDGGATFEPGRVVLAETDAEGLAACDRLGNGHGAVSTLDGTVYLPMVYCGRALLGISRDGGVGWEVAVVDETAGASPDAVDAHEGAVAVDAAGNVHYAWIGADGLPRLSSSMDQGRTWRAPLVLSPADVARARFPALTAGGEGRVALLYFGTADAGAADAAWNAYVSIVYDAREDAPVVATAQVNPPGDPVRRGACEARCGNVGDFFDATVHPVTGAVWVAFADACVDACARDGTPSPPYEGVRAAVGVQVAGPPLGAGG